MDYVGNTSARPETALVTGATGFVGRELVHQLVGRYPGLEVVALVRATDPAMLARRRTSLVHGMPAHHAARVYVVRGDMTAPHLGLDETDRTHVLERVDRVLHCAASIRFDLPLDVARRENVESTRMVLDLCRRLRARGRAGRLDHVSTAFVAGRREGVVCEDELSVGQTFRNTYEQTKLEAEQLCRVARHEMPVTIHRPSIVVGRQSTGETSSYKAAYGPMRLLIQAYNTCPDVLNRLVPLPLPPALTVDLVPVDFVASAIAALWVREDAVGRCFHLAAGVDGDATLEQLANATCDHFGTPRVRAVVPGRGMQWLGRMLAPVLETIAPRAHTIASIMFDYGLGMPRFDTSATRAAGIRPPTVLEYFGQILSFAVSRDFGRRDAAASSVARVRDFHLDRYGPRREPVEANMSTGRLEERRPDSDRAAC
jgi:thioester reductase-like protein